MKRFQHLMAKDIFGCLSPEEGDELRQMCHDLKITDEQYAAMKQKCVSRDLHRDVLAARSRATGRRVAWLRYAAVAVLLLSVGSWFLYRATDALPSAPDASVNSTMAMQKPERKQPLLILATGELVELRREAREEQVAPRIVNTGESLEYEHAAADTTGETLRYNTILVPPAGEFNIRLSDGTQIWLNENTRLKYPETFLSGTREIFLAEGEVYLEVARDTRHPFIVRTPNGRVEVLGTHFNVRCRDRKTVETTLAEGSVKVSAADAETILLPGQQARVTDRIEVAEVDVEEVICWKDNLFFFKNAPLEEILDKLASWYNFELFWQNPDLKNTQFYVYIDKYASVGEILEKLSEAGDIRLTLKERTVIVSK